MTIDTPRMVLRPTTMDDLPNFLSIYRDDANTRLLYDGARSYGQIVQMLTQYEHFWRQYPCSHMNFAAVLKQSGDVIGHVDIEMISHSRTQAEIGCAIMRDHAGNGYATEAEAALVKYCFETLRIRRVQAHCDAENIASYRALEKNGFWREGHFLGERETHIGLRDAYFYALRDVDYATIAMARNHAQKPCVFTDFFNPPELCDGELSLICTKRQDAIPEKRYVPAYYFDMMENGQRAGTLDLRIGYTESLFYGGNIGYTVFEPFRGRSFAVRAVKLILPLARMHGMDQVLVSNNITNIASRRVCEKAGAQLICTARVPMHQELYESGMRVVNIFRIIL